MDTQKVHCNHGHGMDRDAFQDLLSAANPQWAEYMDDLAKKGQKPTTNPDGDVCENTLLSQKFMNIPGGQTDTGGAGRRGLRRVRRSRLSKLSGRGTIKRYCAVIFHLIENNVVMVYEFAQSS